MNGYDWILHDDHDDDHDDPPHDHDCDCILWCVHVFLFFYVNENENVNDCYRDGDEKDPLDLHLYVNENVYHAFFLFFLFCVSESVNESVNVNVNDLLVCFHASALNESDHVPSENARVQNDHEKHKDLQI